MEISIGEKSCSGSDGGYRAGEAGVEMPAVAEGCVLARSNHARLLQRQDWYVSGAALAHGVHRDSQAREVTPVLAAAMEGLFCKGVSVVDHIGFGGAAAHHVELLS